MTVALNIESLKILVIDDDPFTQEFISLTLQSLNIQYFENCLSGSDAIKQVNEGQEYDVIIIDLNMPDMDGIEVLRNLAESQFKGSVILLSAEDHRILDTAKNLAMAHQLNLTEALSKPVSSEVLKDALSKSIQTITLKHKHTHNKFTLQELELAIQNHQIIPYFQPQIRLSDNAFQAVEVLARWQHPEKGLMSPAHFIPLAEKAGVIDSLTHCIFSQALRDLSQLTQSLQTTITLSINLSANSLCNIDLPEILEQQVTETGLTCSNIVLEITESRLIQNLVASLDVLLRLRLKGFGLSIDDFGTGYSSLEQLKKIPFTELKIDRSFVHNTQNNEASSAILVSSVELARRLNMKVVAEGVETANDLAVVSSLNCDLAQGYFIARPMLPLDLPRWFNECPLLPHLSDNSNGVSNG